MPRVPNSVRSISEILLCVAGKQFCFKEPLSFKIDNIEIDTLVLLDRSTFIDFNVVLLSVGLLIKIGVGCYVKWGKENTTTEF